MDADILAPTFDVMVYERESRLDFRVSGFWNDAVTLTFQRKLAESTVVFERAGKSFNAIGDLRDFVPQKPSVTDAMRRSLQIGAKVGLVRLAIVTSSALMRAQYRRVSDTTMVEYFDTPGAARSWLAQPLAKLNGCAERLEVWQDTALRAFSQPKPLEARTLQQPIS